MQDSRRFYCISNEGSALLSLGRFPEPGSCVIHHSYLAPMSLLALVYPLLTLVVILATG